MFTGKKPKVAIVMGSDSDFPILKNCIKVLKQFDVEVDVNVISAHRTPYRAEEFAKNAEANGIDVIIGAAGKAAHLPGVLAAFTTLPVIGLPIKSSTMDGLDSLLSIVQMPKGIPVATVAIDGADNAAILAVQILSIGYEDLKTKLKAFKIEMAKQVEEKNAQIKEEVSKI
ncbi:5-(carboxyamino)imidazole ribonucleotide mutase [Petroclostridium sp. X23]|uniref:5-(carboxyamino)imidazole ribonucleotide mutase n=1 Tax=Petroclostridium sp. X23 TaxID=3045146 RepID=UPI0024ADAEB2|nr:5-(carboxyamino)imidazole ribonucleotide mutase [Petroclostridium sp. X23]WHH58183.1 5-(carboxyamino)imidazole ribonucleotide mutase [Petroclostridium sp. X23]